MGFALGSAGGLDALLERLDPDFEFEEDRTFPEAGVYRGRDEFGAYARQFMDVWDQWDFELKEARDAGSDRVFTRFIIAGEGTAVD
jgi:ketosteroid isomerase-like protein